MRRRSRQERIAAAQVTVRITNLADPDRYWEVLFLVDTRATNSLAPRQHLEAIGLEPRGRRRYELVVDVTVPEIEYMGEVVDGTIIFGEADVESLLGLTALESVGIEVDPRSQQL